MRIFVSYASEQEEWARWIVWELENAKQRYQCLVQFRDFHPGESFIDRMRVGAESDCTIALFSPLYFESRYCLQELDASIVANRLLPIRVINCNPGAFLNSRIYIDLVGVSVDEARRRLLNGVEAFSSQSKIRAASRHVFKDRPQFPGRPTFPQADTQSNECSIPSVRMLRVLFIAPEVGGLSPRRQLKEMQDAVNKVNGRAIKFIPAFDARVNTLFDKLNVEIPHVVHLSGKQNGGEILLRDEEGGLTVVSDMALAGMFKSLDRNIRLVVVDTCFSLRCATTIAEVVPCALGVQGDIYEDDAIVFYKRFYQSLAAGRSLMDAAAQARAALKFAGVSPRRIPQLRSRRDVDPGQIFLVAPTQVKAKSLDVIRRR